MRLPNWSISGEWYWYVESAAVAVIKNDFDFYLSPVVVERYKLSDRYDFVHHRIFIDIAIPNVFLFVFIFSMDSINHYMRRHI